MMGNFTNLQLQADDEKSAADSWFWTIFILLVVAVLGIMSYLSDIKLVEVIK